MADEARKSYPMMATTHWWSLRKKFRAAIPREATPNYLASALGMNEGSARTNILPSLRQTGIIDKDGKPTDLAVRWRDDGQYAAVCDEIRKAVYPQELLDLAPDTSSGRETVKTWFANHTGMGDSGAQKLTAFYIMLLEGDPAKQTDASSRDGTSKPAVKPAVKPVKAVSSKAQPRNETGGEQQDTGKGGSGGLRSQPQFHINVQIHISPESNSEQVDAIFASMAKHLKDFG